jgi:hypothetical protein
VSERARLRELELELEFELELEGAGTADGKRVLERSRGLLCQGSSMSDRFEFIDAEYADNEVAKTWMRRRLCRCVDGLM